MKIPFVILCLAVSLAPIAAAGAQRDQQSPLGGNDHRPPPPPIVSVLDANHDSLIEAAEIAEAPAALLKLDRNEDGELTRDEYTPPRPPMPGGESDDASTRPPAHRGENEDNSQRPPKPRIDAAPDSNRDGIIDKGEIADAPASLRKLDSNGDGTLTPDEYIGQPSRQDGAGSDPGSRRD